VESTPLWDRKVCVLQVTDASEHAMQIRALSSATDSSRAWDLRCFIRENLIRFLQQNYPESLPKTRGELSGGPWEQAAGSSDGHGFTHSNEANAAGQSWTAPARARRASELSKLAGSGLDGHWKQGRLGP
jgi:hypothetical protein